MTVSPNMDARSRPAHPIGSHMLFVTLACRDTASALLRHSAASLLSHRLGEGPFTFPLGRVLTWEDLVASQNRQTSCRKSQNLSGPPTVLAKPGRSCSPPKDFAEIPCAECHVLSSNCATPENNSKLRRAWSGQRVGGEGVRVGQDRIGRAHWRWMRSGSHVASQQVSQCASTPSSPSVPSPVHPTRSGTSLNR